MKKISKKENFINLVKTSAHITEWSNEMTNLCATRPDHISFGEWVKQTEWTFGAIISFFQYQCLQMNGELDWIEFEEEYSIFKTKIYGFI